MNKYWYASQAKKHFKLYEKALNEGKQLAAAFHMSEYLTYDKASK